MIIELIGDFTIDLLSHLPAELLIVGVMALCLSPIEDWFFRKVSV